MIENIFTVTHQRDDKNEYIDYRGPSIDHAYAALESARDNVDKGTTGWVSMRVWHKEISFSFTLVWEETGATNDEG